MRIEYITRYKKRLQVRETKLEYLFDQMHEQPELENDRDFLLQIEEIQFEIVELKSDIADLGGSL